jgi:hypothetical protein
MAFDDFVCTNSGPISWIRWWGVVLDPDEAQLNRRVYIAIHANTQGPCPPLSAVDPCNPGPRLAFWCVQPSHKYAGLDCLGRKVYRFTAPLAPPFTQTTGTHYWLTICEIDQESARPGLEDFRWSGFRVSATAPYNHCPAQLIPPPGFDCDVTDDCPNPSDLSFELRRYCIPIILVPPIIINPPLLFQVDIRAVSAPMTSPSLMSEAVEVDSNGIALMDHNLPDGQYRLTMRGMATGDYSQIIQIEGGLGSPASFFDVFVGDLNNDGLRNGNDVAPFVEGLLNP